MPRANRSPVRQSQAKRGGLLSRLVASRRGSTAVEFAIAAPVLFLFLFGIFEFGRLFWTRSSLQFAVEETGRYAMVNNAASADDITAYVVERLPGVTAGDVTIAVTPEVAGGVNFVTILATVQFQFVTTGLWAPSPIAISGRSRVPRDP